MTRPVGDENIEQLLGNRATADREHRSQPAALRLSFSLRPLPAGDIDLEPAPAKRSPEERLDEAHRLHAAGPDRLGGQRDQAATKMETFVILGYGEPELLVEAPPDDGDRRDDPDEAATQNARGRRAKMTPRTSPTRINSA